MNNLSKCCRYLLTTLFTMVVIEHAIAATPVELSNIERQIVTEKADLVANLRANDTVDLAAEVAGIIDKILFNEGGQVAKGDVLIELDDQLFKAELRRAEANYQLATMRFERDRKLFEKNTISQAVFEETQAELFVSKAALDVAKVRLEKTKIVAPFSGYVGLRNLSVGDYVSPGESLLSIVNDNPVLIDFSLPQRLAGALKVGDEIMFTVANASQQRLAKVIAIEQSMRHASRSLPVRALYENNQRDVLSGNYANVHIEVASEQQHVVIPSQALIGISGGYIVYIVQEGKAVRQNANIIRRDMEFAVLEDNFPADVQVVIAGHQTLRPGAEITAVSVGD
jgi:membrane fusion protein (multidrug efflux system)